MILFHTCNHDEELTRLVKDSFSTENFGVKVVEKPMRSMQDERALKILEATTRRIGERFETGLLWKHDNLVFTESKSVALRRLNCLERKMDRDQEFSAAYSAKIEDLISKGYARELSKEETSVELPKTSYMAHFAVTYPNKPGKIRPVFDAAAKSGEVSLNDNLLKGPDLLNPLPPVIWRFREYPIGGAGDVEEMFPQVKIIPEDQHAQRFFWRGTDRKHPPKVFMMTFMVFGIASSPASATYVKIKNAEEFQSEFPIVYEAVLKQTFMDDQLDGGQTVEEFSEHIMNVIEVYRRGGFKIRNWASNSLEVLQKIPSEFRAKGFVDLSLQSEAPVERVLGVQWRTSKDEFFFILKFHRIDQEIVSGARVPSNRQVLALMMSIYDPLGFLAPMVVKVRILFQGVWRSGIGWDDQLTQNLNIRWLEWLKLLKNVEEFSIPRCYHSDLRNAKSVQLHMFNDASLEAFTTVAYLRIEFPHAIRTAFVTAKAKVALLKLLSVPKLELQAAVMGPRLAEVIRKELKVKIDETHYWSDSKTVLSWIQSDSRTYRQFVSHRIGDVLESTDASDWHWVPTNLNVADEATRSEGGCDVSKESRWLWGPEFLKETREKWHTLVEKIDPTDEELRKDSVLVTSSPLKTDDFSLLPDVKRFSNWMRLIRATAYVDRIGRSKLGMLKSARALTQEDLNWAKRLWWRRVQAESFPEDLKSLTRGGKLEPQSRLRNLSVFLDGQGLLRVKSRIVESEELGFDAKFPIVLDPKHRFVELMVLHYHRQAAHQGKETVVNELRQLFWMPALRAAVKKALACCPLCRVRKAKPVAPPMGNLPTARVEKQLGPYMQTGMDFFGPLWAKVRRSKEKRYGVIFTCLSTRAVHLEVAASLSTDSAINAVRRFICRRGKPQMMIYDNATNFQGVSRELKEALKELDFQELRGLVVAAEMRWSFIPPSSPHMGRSWERLIRSVKVALESTLSGRVVGEEVLQTLMVEVEGVLNSRPLTYVSVDPNDPESLTPNHFLRRPFCGTSVPGVFLDEDLRLRRQWRQVQRLVDYFWIRWVKEYLPALTRRAKWFREVTPLKVGDIVVIADNQHPRNTWPMGVIVRTFPGKDNQVRVVDVRTKDGVYRRPAVKICKLDVRRDDEK